MSSAETRMLKIFPWLENCGWRVQVSVDVIPFENGRHFLRKLSVAGFSSTIWFSTEDPLLEQCERRLHVPTDVPEVDYGGGKNSAVEKALGKGFEVKYTVSQDCTKCLGSEGNCSRHGVHFYQNLCHYCPDGSHALHCSKREIHWTMKLILGITAGVMGGFMICIIICSTKCMSSTKVKLWLTLKNDQVIESFLKHHGALAQKRYKFSEVKKMTNSFKVKLGEGGFGAVYKGQLLSGCPVAVKILNASKGNGEYFINEVASISRTSHVNIVTLLGFSSEGRKKALIYEFFPMVLLTSLFTIRVWKQLHPC
ncbi:hypothetical protein GLYMA_07G094700v4 [Glycine max]|nr:hypothetical protein GLYMA_07G094700v4 [Glycine max]|eukprot:XP_014633366.1 LEAF RUST 10 DISEASE-RESISTANCE LOCUS RECEPTOR-LIKE PROTEIN KINASE-like 2.1 [Glycine max]